MTALSSARADLFPHQVEVVRRVLEDPRQRYLLADEVGLGKTIEAGILLRQFLLDVPAGRALVVVPPLLVAQWRHELDTRVDVLRDGRVEIVSSTDLLSAPDAREFGMLVVDEAHHLAADALSRDPAAQARFDVCRRLAHGIGRVLLLSATPAANHEAQFLAMLHLLEPEAYALDDISAFQRRIRARQDIGQKLLTLTEHARPLPLKMTLAWLLENLPDDEVLRALVDDVRARTEEAPTDAQGRAPLVRALRAHIGETYRLHRRMIRNRRGALADAIVDRSHARLEVHYDTSESTRRIEDALDEWRALAALGAQTTATENAQCMEAGLASVFALFLEAADGAPALLEAAARFRGGDGRPATVEELAAAWAPETIANLLSAPFFTGEIELLSRIAEAAGDQAAAKPRMQVLERLLRALRDRVGIAAPPKCLVFASTGAVAQTIADRLGTAFGRGTVARHLMTLRQPDVETEVSRFQASRDCFVLVCDTSAEEGRNFQFATHLVHYDLPWHPNRLEQRIGRADRISRLRDLTMHVLLDSANDRGMSRSWFEVLRDGFGIFSDSIASLQFYVDRQVPVLRTTALLRGADGLRQDAQMMHADIADERRRLDEQEAIDEIDARDARASEFFEALDAADAREGELREAIDGWLCGVLNFERNISAQPPRVVRYLTNKRVLVPEDILRSHFTPFLNRPGTYARAVAGRHPNIALHRLGDGLVDAVARYIEWDDRGRAFAIWRHEADWDPGEGAEWVGFRFAFVVSADTRGARRVLSEAASARSASLESLDRRADSLCPPRTETVFLDTSLREVTDAAMLARLRRPFRNADQGGTDHNLTKHRQAAIDSVVAPEVWEETCRSARAAAERLVRERESFRRRYSELAASAARTLLIGIEQLEVRERRSRGTPRLETLPLELVLEHNLADALVHGIEAPMASVDAVGFVVVSGRPPLGSPGVGVAEDAANRE